jgi:hypothetical protein
MRMMEAAIVVEVEGPEAAGRFTDQFGQRFNVERKDDGAIEISSDQPLGKPLLLRIEPLSAKPKVVIPDDDR